MASLFRLKQGEGSEYEVRCRRTRCNRHSTLLHAASLFAPQRRSTGTAPDAKRKSFSMSGSREFLPEPEPEALPAVFYNTTISGWPCVSCYTFLPASSLSWSLLRDASNADTQVSSASTGCDASWDRSNSSKQTWLELAQGQLTKL